jgi:general stress protein 26
MEARMTTTMMPPVPEITESQITAFLAAAHETIAAVPICWLATRSLEGGTNTRAVNSFAGTPGSDTWTRRVLVRRNSRKVADIRAAPLVTLAYQHSSGDRWVTLGGRAAIVDDLAEIRMLWPSAMDPHFPPGFADANMVVIRIDVNRIEVHVRGLTAEPFGTGRTLLERQPEGSWRYIPISPPVGASSRL